MKTIKRALSLFLALTLMVSGFSGFAPLEVNAEEAASEASTETAGAAVSGIAAAAMQEYQIYPKPQNTVYNDGTFVITPQANVVFEDGIDDPTKEKLKEVLASKGITYTESSAVVAGTTNILVGINGSGGYADSYFTGKIVHEETFFDKIDSYILSADKGTIAILGNTTDAAFYGLVSLKHIFTQMESRTIRNFRIDDYADTAIRGFIEGYYGIPWSNEDRMSLMEFGGDFKMTSYVFAPKDDPYHKSRWAELYPAENLEAIAEMARVGVASKCRFVWTVHPFSGSWTDVDGNIAKVIAKFEQLYSVGIRQFGVLGDDVGSLNKEAVIKLMNALNSWVEAKGDVYDLVFCPAGYNNAWTDCEELNVYELGFDENIHIFWTGDSVCGHVTQGTVNNFKTRNLSSALAAAGEVRRDPLFWLNWPVNDINMARILMGKAEVLNPGVKNLAGVVTNPMQDAEASKVAIFQVADYAWNTDDFDDDRSWSACFDYVDADAGDELHTLAKHMSDPSPNGHGLNLGESEDLKAQLDAFRASLDAGESILAKGEALISEFEMITEACDGFQAKSKNEALKDELLPFTNSLKDLADANIGFIKTAIALEKEDNNAVWSSYSQASSLFEQSKNYDRVIINGTKKAAPGSKRLIPFAAALKTALAAEVSAVIGTDTVFTTVITSRTDTPTGDVSNITDGNKSTAAIWKNPSSSVAGDYVGIIYNKTVHMSDVEFRMGTDANPNDTFQNAKIQYTADGKTWVDLSATVYGDTQDIITVTGLDLDIKGIRLIATTATSNVWIACREITVNKAAAEAAAAEDAANAPITTTLSKSSTMTVYSGLDANLTDGDDSTFVWYKTGVGSATADTALVGDYIALDLGRAVELGKIHFAVGGTSGSDHWTSYDFEYSTNNSTWTKYGNTISQAVTKLATDLDLSGTGITARYVRLVNKVQKGNWAQFSEFSVKSRVYDKVYTNVKAYAALTTTVEDSMTSIDAASGITLAQNEYIGIKLNRIKDLSSITTNVSLSGLTLETSRNEVEWTAVTDLNTLEDARYIRIINKTASTATFHITSFKVNSAEYAEKSMVSNTFGSVETPLNVFDNDRTTEAIYKNSQTAGYNIVYDLGRTIDLDTIKIVLNDSNVDFPRHAKLSVSSDKTNWTEVLTIGSQTEANPGEAANTDSIFDVMPDHEISYCVKEAAGISKAARYLKFEITRSKVGDNKWTRIREIEINNGAYIPSINNPTVVTDAELTNGYEKENLFDGDVSTMFSPATDAAGEAIYYLSEKTAGITQLTILQKATEISDAAVSIYVPEGNSFGWVEVGSLKQSINQFCTKDFSNVLAVKIKWAAGVKPGIYEIITTKDSMADVSKTALQEQLALAKAADISSWIPEDSRKLADAIEIAEAFAANEYIAQTAVDSAANSLADLLANHRTTGSLSDFAAAIAAKELDFADSSLYTAKSWKAFQEALNSGKAIAADKNQTQESLDEINAMIGAAAMALVYEMGSIEDLILLVEQLAPVRADSATYAVESKEVFDRAYDAAVQCIADNLVTSINPLQVREIKAAADAAKTSLVPSDPIKAFVERLYRKVLGRTAEESEISYYTTSLKAQEKTGADVGRGFVFSPEFTRQNLSNEEYVEVLYGTFMDRGSDAGGMEYWKNYLDNGVSRLFVFKGFVESPEYSAICSGYGIERGEVHTDKAMDINPNLTMYVNRLYAKALGREAEADGLNYYAEKILAGEVTPIQVAQNFIFSDEFRDKNLSDADYIKTLYRTFLGREFEQGGLDYYLEKIESGTSKEEILSGFAHSPEFTGIVESFGLK
ncbi:beta-N-acetylglucosaminidase domain-containing protein [Anaerobium acetethylicum]|uniref:Hyaluronoglucosaminidase/hexosaminidase n=1 Tax=Anaerobium acetethylicum TaxID=1619234 RepID=A0A1D3TTY9_9FIRM|nr:beta-N-acetylglucosaminidase domain-containing protein [Anaerobium acetethylicum]SCP97494.1 hyaluronoglucosaminidase/hexosaminidase [Anaerobium acetethylicum]